MFPPPYYFLHSFHKIAFSIILKLKSLFLYENECFCTFAPLK
ncbi:hypothetical protein M067_2378 [Bacteroides fragilis str. J-143-4]|nr:hypothetical protein M067_2378 [Bacteroides fragilis str. J-143-4]